MICSFLFFSGACPPFGRAGLFAGSLLARPCVFFAALKKLGLACGHPLPSLSRSSIFFLLAFFFGSFGRCFLFAPSKLGFFYFGRKMRPFFEGRLIESRYLKGQFLACFFEVVCAQWVNTHNKKRRGSTTPTPMLKQKVP